METFDVAVIGAGVMGSATARALARSGKEVLVLEQFESGHKRGSSHGTARIFRLSYPEPDYVEMAHEALGLWRDLEEEVGRDILTITGGLDVGPHIQANSEALEKCDVAYEILEPVEAERRFPVVKLPKAESVLFQAGGGVVAADSAVKAFGDSARHAGADMRFDSKVTALEPAGGAVMVITDAGRFLAGVVVVTAGAWANELLEPLGLALPVRPTRETVAYYHLDSEAIPTLVEWGDPAVYALPSPGDGVKVGEHIAGPTTDPNHEGTVDRDSVERLSGWMAEHFPGAEATPSRAETCLYTNTADENFILERHGRIVVGSPCSGHGFKFAPLIGKRLAALAV